MGRGECGLEISPYGVAADGAGFLYVADTSNHTIRKVVLSTGAVTTLAGSVGQSGSTDGAGAAARFSSPQGVAADGAGSLYVADFENHTIRKIALTNAADTTVAGIAGQGGVKLGPLPAQLNSPTGIAVLPTGEIFLATTNENAILKMH